MKPRNRVDKTNRYTLYLRTITDTNGNVLLDHDIVVFSNKTYGIVCRYSNVRGSAKSIYGWYLHRIGGPAKIDKFHGFIGWYVNGVVIYDTRDYCAACGYSETKTVLWLLKYGDKLPDKFDQL